MHIIAAITAIAGLVWALYRLHNSGVDLNSFNPFYWARRKKWENQLNSRPLHRLDKPLDAAAVLLVGIAKTEGEISREQKADILHLFQSEFSLTESQASELFSASSHMLQGVIDLPAEVGNILAPSMDQFQTNQAESLLNMLVRVASLEQAISETQSKVITQVENTLRDKPVEAGTW